ncbi:MAG: hypothetical protein J7497_15045, partial [Chitinophagaceae bacterium]|nr:hypothetical protein [Chitinophagaceae bacterium]
MGGELVGFILGDDTPIKEKIREKNDYDCASRYLGIRPIIIELSIKDATLNRLKIPGLGEIDLKELYSYVNTFKVTVSINGVAKPTLTYPAASPANYTVTMGDDISVKVESSAPVTPEIHGATKVWPAAFAGDMTFHCDPDVQPGSYYPFIGLDTRVHTLMLRPYPNGFVDQAPDWNPKGQLQSQTGLYNYAWSWTADRQSDGTKTKYSPSLIWPKAHLDTKYRQSDGSYALTNADASDCTKCKSMTYNHGVTGYQRQDQKEGLNMQYLTYFKNWVYSDFQNYGINGKTSYMEGFDDDELGYFNLKDPKPPGGLTPCNTPGCQNTSGITKLEVLPWKAMPEGANLTVNEKTGFPDAAGGFSLNWMIDAYRRSHNDLTPYRGYEIQDQNVDWNHADGTGSNNTHPGKVDVMIGNAGQKISLLFTVNSPLDQEDNRSLGFYEALVGESNPSVAEQGVRYWLRGVKGKTDSEIAKYTLVYSWMDRLGRVTEKSANVLNDVITPWRSTQSNWQNWVNTRESSSVSAWWSWLDWGTGKGFEMERPAYAWMTAYYQRTP